MEVKSQQGVEMEEKRADVAVMVSPVTLEPKR